jgi:hypothetical protein
MLSKLAHAYITFTGQFEENKGTHIFRYILSLCIPRRGRTPYNSKLKANSFMSGLEGYGISLSTHT